MSEHTTNYHPANVLNCSENPFGYLIAQAAGNEPIGDERLSSAVRNKVDALITSVICLVKSDSVVHANAVNAIGKTFNAHDKAALPPILDIAQQPNILRWIAGSPVKDVARFAQWNVGRHQALQAALNRDQPMFDEDTMSRVDNLIDIGLFPKGTKGARAQMETTIGRYGTFSAMDSFESGAMNARGYCTEESMALSNLYDSKVDMTGVSPEMAGTVFHERLHGPLSHGTGFISVGLNSHGGPGLRWLEEASVTHAAAVTNDPNTPQPCTIDPYKRTHETTDEGAIYSGVYLGERAILAAADIPADLLYHARFTRKNTKARLEVEDRLGGLFKSFGSDDGKEALYRFSAEYEKPGHGKTRQGVLDPILDKIYSRDPSSTAIYENEMPSDLEVIQIREWKPTV